MNKGMGSFAMDQARRAGRQVKVWGRKNFGRGSLQRIKQGWQAGRAQQPKISRNMKIAAGVGFGGLTYGMYRMGKPKMADTYERNMTYATPSGDMRKGSLGWKRMTRLDHKFSWADADLPKGIDSPDIIENTAVKLMRTRGADKNKRAIHLINQSRRNQGTFGHYTGDVLTPKQKALARRARPSQKYYVSLLRRLGKVNKMTNYAQHYAQVRKQFGDEIQKGSLGFKRMNRVDRALGSAAYRAELQDNRRRNASMRRAYLKLLGKPKSYKDSDVLHYLGIYGTELERSARGIPEDVKFRQYIREHGRPAFKYMAALGREGFNGSQARKGVGCGDIVKGSLGRKRFERILARSIAGHGASHKTRINFARDYTRGNLTDRGNYGALFDTGMFSSPKVKSLRRNFNNHEIAEYRRRLKRIGVLKINKAAQKAVSFPKLFREHFRRHGGKYAIGGGAFAMGHLTRPKKEIYHDRNTVTYKPYMVKKGFMSRAGKMIGNITGSRKARVFGRAENSAYDSYNKASQFHAAARHSQPYSLHASGNYKKLGDAYQQRADTRLARSQRIAGMGVKKPSSFRPVKQFSPRLANGLPRPTEKQRLEKIHEAMYILKSMEQNDNRAQMLQMKKFGDFINTVGKAQAKKLLK